MALELNKYQKEALFISGYFNPKNNHDMLDPKDYEHIDYIARRLQRMCEGKPKTLESSNCNIADVTNRTFAKKIVGYKCLLCGRDKFIRRTPHNCVGGYRKRHLKWEPIFEEQYGW